MRLVPESTDQSPDPLLVDPLTATTSMNPKNLTGGISVQCGSGAGRTAVVVASADAAPPPSAASETITTIVARTCREPLVVVVLAFMMVSPYIRYGHEAVG